MRKLLSFTALIVSSIVLQQSVNSSLVPLPPPDFPPRLEPCGVVRQFYENWKIERENNLTFQALRVPAQIAADCLLSVPLNRTDELVKISELKKYLAFQSTPDWAADPPNLAVRRVPINVTAGLNGIAAKVVNGAYNGTYEVAADIKRLLTRMRDGHLSWSSPCMEGAILFRHRFPLVHLWNEDGSSDVYAASDFTTYERMSEDRVLGRDPDDNSPISPITHINNEPVDYYLRDFSLRDGGSVHDLDALWNSLFLHPDSSGFEYGAFTSTKFIPSHLDLTFTFRNGSQIKEKWLAQVKGNFQNVTDGASYYRQNSQLFQPPPRSSSTPRSSLASSYILPNSTGVLAIHTFGAETDLDIKTFLNFTRSAIATFKSSKLSHLIIDVSSNPGGAVALGYDTLSLLFPESPPVSARTNLRAHPAIRIIANSTATIVSHFLENPPPSNANRTELKNYSKTLSRYQNSPFSFSPILTTTENTPFCDWKDAYGPVKVRNDEYTQYMRFNLTSPPFLSPPPDPAPSVQPWDIDDILVFGNGMCSSTCSLFVSALQDLGVRTVAHGGRPAPGPQRRAVNGTDGWEDEVWQEGPMQAVGGVEGSEVLNFDQIWQWAQVARDVIGRPGKYSGAYSSDLVARLAKMVAASANDGESEGGEAASDAVEEEEDNDDDVDCEAVEAAEREGLPTRKLRGPGSINLRNAFDKGWDVPREFTYRPADYRIRMTSERWKDVGKAWREAARQAWWDVAEVRRARGGGR